MKNNSQITTKVCFKCKKDKSIDDYYVLKAMADGHLNKCKTCTKIDVKDRAIEKRKDPDWIKKERERSREKYHRLNYKDKHKPTAEQKRIINKRHFDKYPEKYKAKKASSGIAKKKKSNHNHHWSYNEEHWKDVIELTPKLHNLIHRLMDYDQSTKMYINALTSELLDTKEKHLLFVRMSKFRHISEF